MEMKVIIDIPIVNDFLIKVFKSIQLTDFSKKYGFTVF